MRAAEFLLVAAFVALVGLGIWNFRSWLPALALHPATAAVAKATPVARPTVKRPGTKTAKGAQSAGTLELPFDPKSVSTIEIPVGAPFPTTKDLTAGMTAMEIRDRFGDPIVRVTGEQKGELFEKYYYINREHTLATVANLQGGIVVSAESISL